MKRQVYVIEGRRATSSASLHVWVIESRLPGASWEPWTFGTWNIYDQRDAQNKASLWQSNHRDIDGREYRATPYVPEKP